MLLLQVWLVNVQNLRRFALKFNVSILLCLGHENVVEILIQNGANVNLSNNIGMTAMHSAAEIGKSKIHSV